MVSGKFRRAIGAVKDQTSIGLAKVSSNSDSMADLDIAIVKATRHEEQPAEERYIREILSLTSYSRNYIRACVCTLSRRLNKTRNWTVALKTLMLIQRLLAEGDPAYEQEIFFATRRGTRLLNMSDFRDGTQSSNAWDYSAFVRTYALYLDERLEYRMQSKRGKRSVYVMDEEEREEVVDQATAITVRSTPVRELKQEHIISRIQHLQQLLERFLACRPTGSAKNHRVVIVALYPTVKESFQIYYDITEILGILIDRFMELEVPESVKVYEIFCRVAKQFDDLDAFYKWCKNTGIVRSSEYPEVERISPKRLDLMDEFIRDKSALALNRTKYILPKDETEEETKEEEEQDMNTIKALPPPEDFVEEPQPEEPEQALEVKEEEVKNNTQEEFDLLNLGEDAITTEEHGDNLALALFNGAGQQNRSPGWEAFANDSGDWETALVLSASNLSSEPTASLPGGFDMLLLDGMYQKGAQNAAVAATTAHGSASSVALGSAGQPAMLALPAPPSSGGNAAGTVKSDPFAASLAVAAPSYVQMSDMEKKQRLLVEEQMAWQQYQRDGMQGNRGFSNMTHNHQNLYNPGGY